MNTCIEYTQNNHGSSYDTIKWGEEMIAHLRGYGNDSHGLP